MDADTYRSAPARCPTCRVAMEERSVDESLVDLCPQCHGLWLDWFDGDTITLVYDLGPISMRPATSTLEGAECPRCTKPLAPRRHEKWGPEVLRCDECAGTFVPRVATDALLEWSASVDMPTSKDTPSAFAKLIATLKALFHPTE